ncbi:bifunctional 4-hydroxy-2-oxoglutarate aldolase/2-dehydro-3-deoxy-phosphogluconate aldolase [Legionella beliardensis]|uniref:bifunctional 4-hydroxy-2-oxoglutarate aldolase/2-dehydro-3-deoxy-phosphogluconate aldolase n=1 Tax=Legionella beliardensis TaxID=91822 RepID=UPI000E1B74FF|nr:bifunctional 4-hydroxy-2-oxoglutarate aldolase/2-dehydro-3-deoxy-phosphogluconate aldolase [Legionella beliardensis]
MMTDKLFNTQTIIVTLDVDALLFNRLEQVAQAGFSAVEINTHDTGLLKAILEQFPGLRIGAANILNTEQLENCYQAGVHFASSPGFLPAIAQTAAIYSINYLPGIATISEAMQVMALGYSQARPYPSTLSFCALLNRCLPMLRLFPTEVEWDEAEHYLSLPCVDAVSILNPESTQLSTLSTAIFA